MNEMEIKDTMPIAYLTVGELKQIIREMLMESNGTNPQETMVEKKVCEGIAISDVEMSVRLYNILMMLGANSTTPMAELQQLSRRDYARMRCMGPKSLAELEKLFRENGLQFSVRSHVWDRTKLCYEGVNFTDGANHVQH